MLHNPDWDKTPSFDGFVAWLQQQDPKKKYDYWDVHRCPIAQYLETVGTTYSEFCAAGNAGMLRRWNGHVTAGGRQTLGAALKRALKHQASQSRQTTRVAA